MAYGTPQQTHRRPPPPRRGIPVWVWIVGAVVAVLGIAPFLIVDALSAKGDHLGSGSKVTAPASKTSAPARPAPTTAAVTKKQFGKRWPFVHITAGTVRCIPRPGGGAIIFTAADGRTFGLNGTALDAGYSDIPAGEWRKDPDIPGASINVGPLRDPVAKACGLATPS